MDPLSHLLATGQRDTLQFFFAGLRDVTADEHVDSPTLLYNASVLAHFASTSTFSPESLPALRGLGDVFDRFVTDTSMRRDTELMEWGAAQCMLFTGFFADQMQRRHNLDWYGHLGEEFYDCAATATQEANRKRLMGRMAEEFQDWRRRYLKLARELRDLPYLIPG
jgi:hypothetical protein